MREFVRILLGFLIGTSEEKIEGAVMELFAVAFPWFSKREAPFCFLVFFSLFKECDRLDLEFFKKEADQMLAESIASLASSQQMQLLNLDRSPIQNIVLFVLYWNQKYASTWSFQFNLCSFLRAIHEII